MVLRNVKDFDCTSIHINHPYKHADEYYIGEVYYNKEPFIIQTPIMTLKNIEDNTVELLLDKLTLKMINRTDNYIIRTLSDMSEDWFKNKLSIEDARDIYKSSISFPIDEYDSATIRLKCNKNFKIYDKYNTHIEKDKINVGTPLIALIKLNVIVFYRHTCIAQWECMSIKLKQKNTITKCIIDDEHTDDETNNDENIKVVNLNEYAKLF